MSQEAEVNEPTLFPFPLSFHIAFVCIGVVFFVFRFLKLRKPYQIILAAAMFCSLALPVSEGNKGLFYLVGAVEALLLIAALVTSIVCQDHSDEAAATAEGSAATQQSEAAEGGDNADSAQDSGAEDETGDSEGE